MGSCLSAMTAPRSLLDDCDGNEADYNNKYLEDRVLGEGEFGTVKLVYSIENRNAPPMAVKVLHKGVTFKDNVLYSPLKPTVLRLETKILKTLNGEHFILKLFSVYETSIDVYMVTEYCAGGEMMEWVSKSASDLDVASVSRISYQLLDALCHCNKHGVIHRDIKPENIMFVHRGPDSPLRLIDFGSSTMDSVDMDKYDIDKIAVDNPAEDTANGSKADNDGLLTHTTFAGSAFYISPEMFQHKYTAKTDVWSVGVALYVLVAGFPSESMQKAFDTLQTSESEGGRDLRTLPNMPDDLPVEYFDMLDQMLVYRHTDRSSSKEILSSDFVNLHKASENEVLDISDVLNDAHKHEADQESSVSNRKSIAGTIRRHTTYLGFQKFERSVTTLLAAVLTKEEQKSLLVALRNKIAESDNGKDTKNLQIIKVSLLKEVLESLQMERA